MPVPSLEEESEKAEKPNQISTHASGKSCSHVDSVNQAERVQEGQQGKYPDINPEASKSRSTIIGYQEGKTMPTLSFSRTFPVHLFHQLRI